MSFLTLPLSLSPADPDYDKTLETLFVPSSNLKDLSRFEKLATTAYGDGGSTKHLLVELLLHADNVTELYAAATAAEAKNGNFTKDGMSEARYEVQSAFYALCNSGDVIAALKKPYEDTHDYFAEAEEFCAANNLNELIEKAVKLTAKELYTALKTSTFVLHKTIYYLFLNMIVCKDCFDLQAFPGGFYSPDPVAWLKERGGVQPPPSLEFKKAENKESAAAAQSTVPPREEAAAAPSKDAAAPMKMEDVALEAAAAQAAMSPALDESFVLPDPDGAESAAEAQVLIKQAANEIVTKMVALLPEPPAAAAVAPDLASPPLSLKKPSSVASNDSADEDYRAYVELLTKKAVNAALHPLLWELDNQWALQCKTDGVDAQSGTLLAAVEKEVRDSVHGNTGIKPDWVFYINDIIAKDDPDAFLGIMKGWIKPREVRKGKR